MATNVTFQQPSIFHELQDDIARLRHEVNQQELKKGEKIEFEFQVDHIARAIVEAPLKKRDRDALNNQLLQLRDLTIHHIPVKDLEGTYLSLNTIQNIPPSPICPAYNKMAFPTISTYHEIGNNFVCFRLDPKALKHVPPQVLEKVGSLEGKDTDLLCTVVLGEFSRYTKHPLNNNVHHWAHIHALPGDDTAFDVNMGIFPEIGLQKSDMPGAIAFNDLSPMNVHVHPREGRGNNMLYSPDNAHFNPVPGSPFSVDWSVMQKDDRVGITKRIILFDETHPICQAIINSIHGCRHLCVHLNRLPGISDAIDETFEAVIDAFATNDPKAMDMFRELPPAFKHGIYKETWVAFGSPPDIHLNFGWASFEKDQSLDAQYHCNHKQRADAVQRFSNRLKTLLVDSQIDLLHSQSLVKGDNVLTMMTCARLFYEQDTANAWRFYNHLSDQEKKATHDAFWELNGCERIDNYGAKNFPAEIATPADRKLKIKSLLLAASRQPHRFERPLVENLVPDNELPPKFLTQFQQQQQPQPQNAPFTPDNSNPEDFDPDGFADIFAEFLSCPNRQFNSLTGEIIFAHNVVDNNVRVEEAEDEEEELPASSAYATTTASTSSTSSTSSTTTTTTAPTQTIQERVNAQLMDLIFTQGFQTLGNEEKAKSVNQILAQLPDELRDKIYGSVWYHSSDPHKGGDTWGQDHVVDDLTVLVNALQEVLGATV